MNRKHFFTVRVFKHWNRFPREVAEFPSLETIKIYLGIVLNDLLQLSLLEQGVWIRWSVDMHLVIRKVGVSSLQQIVV